MTDFQKVALTSEIPKGGMKKIMLGSQQVLLANVNGKFYAIGNVCTHMGGPLDKGKLAGNEVECPWHGSHFDVTTGQVKRGPAGRPEPVYETKVEGNEVQIRPKQ
jgi:3-phenylpropionate/trans-cinnamate dioxygenase ferredoxin component